MLLEHFGLIEQPFGVTPDPRFLHLGPKHREALASLVYGTEMNRGFLALTAPPGMGKTSLLFHYLEGLRGRARTAFLFHHAQNPRDLMRYLLSDLGLDASGKDLPEMHEMLNQVLTEEMHAGRRLILVVDEAQNLSEEVLESVRLLSNFETPWMKLMQIVIAGQPELAEKLARPSMAQLKQRVSSFIRLEPFTPQETNAYIDHRLWVAGYAGPPPFSVGARLLIAGQSEGIPRNINTLCFHSMAVACAIGKKQVDAQMVREVVADRAIELGASQSGRILDSRSDGRANGLSRSAGEVQTSWLSLPPAHSSRTVPAAALACILLAALIAFGSSWKGALAHALDGLRVEAAAPAERTKTDRTSAPSAPTNEAVSPDAEKLPEEPPAIAASNGGVLSVPVERGATLRHLSLLYLDRFDAKTLNEICVLNPGITDPNHLEAGQRLRLPVYLRRAERP